MHVHVCMYGLKLSIWPMRSVERPLKENGQLSQAFRVGAKTHGIVNFGGISGT